MRHPLFRILCALLVGLVSPICCCRAAAVLGGPCPLTPIEASAPARDSCCGSDACRGDAPGDERAPTAPAAPDDQYPDRCPSCPSCEVRDATTEPAPTVKSTPDRAVPLPVALIAPGLLDQLVHSWRPRVQASRGQVHWSGVRAGRDVQRWHCALVI